MSRYKVPTMQEVLEKEKEEKFKVVSLFAGGGGSSTGYRMAGGKILAINEFVEKAQESYNANYPSTYIFKEDVRELTGEIILKTLNLKKGELDILDGSPPCSAFSMCGIREKGWGKDKKYSDNKVQRVDDLFFEYLRILKEVQPKVCVAENVKGLISGDAKKYLKEILKGFQEAGYNIKAKVLYACDYGVPQSRPRLIFIGIRNDIEYNDNILGSRFPKKLYNKNNFITLNEAFETLVNTKEDLELAEIKNKDSKIYNILVNTKPGDSFSVANSKLYNKHSFFSHYKLDLNKISFTCTTSRDLYHPDNRYMTLGELKRILSIPDDYINLGTVSQQVERLGRMVAPLMMKAIAENIYNKILSKDVKKMKNLF